MTFDAIEGGARTLHLAQNVSQRNSGFAATENFVKVVNTIKTVHRPSLPFREKSPHFTEKFYMHQGLSRDLRQCPATISHMPQGLFRTPTCGCPAAGPPPMCLILTLEGMFMQPVSKASVVSPVNRVKRLEVFMKKELFYWLIVVMFLLLPFTASAYQFDQSQMRLSSSFSANAFAPVGQSFVPQQNFILGVMLKLSDAGGAGIGNWAE